MSVLASEMGTSILVLEMFECTSTLSSGPSACGYMYSQKNKSNLLPCVLGCGDQEEGCPVGTPGQHLPRYPFVIS